VTLYFGISPKHLDLCLNKLWSVKSVLYTRNKCGGMNQVQTIKILAPNLKQELNYNTCHSMAKYWISIIKFILGELIKMSFPNKFA
jgi:hypothetical protein